MSALLGRFLSDGPHDAPVTLVLAHGAGTPMDSPFLNTIAAGVAGDGSRVLRFEFPYMESRRKEGRRGGAPDAEPVLRKRWLEVISELTPSGGPCGPPNSRGGGQCLVIGGKSLGGRIASLIAEEAGARGLVCLGYPFHPPGNRRRLRTKHLEKIRVPSLIVQGTRDPFGSREEVLEYRLSERVRIVWIEDGDHSLRPRARSGRMEAENLAQAVAAVSGFLRNLAGGGLRT